MNNIEDKIRKAGAYSVGLNGVAVVDNTFWFDFSVADAYGADAIKDTYKRSFECFKKDIEYITALAITLNHKGWEKYEQGKEELSKLYFDLWKKLDGFILDGVEDGNFYKYKNFTSAEITYYIRATD